MRDVRFFSLSSAKSLSLTHRSILTTHTGVWHTYKSPSLLSFDTLLCLYVQITLERRLHRNVICTSSCTACICFQLRLCFNLRFTGFKALYELQTHVLHTFFHKNDARKQRCVHCGKSTSIEPNWNLDGRVSLDCGHLTFMCDQCIMISRTDWKNCEAQVLHMLRFPNALRGYIENKASV